MIKIWETQIQQQLYKSMAESWRTSSQIMHYAHSKRTKAASDLCRNNGSSWYCIMLHHPGKLELKWGDLTGIWYIMMKSDIPQHALNNHLWPPKTPLHLLEPRDAPAPCTRYQRVQSQGCRWHIGCPPGVVKGLLNLTPRYRYQLPFRPYGTRSWYCLSLLPLTLGWYLSNIIIYT